MKTPPRTVLITGSTSGIGKALAKQWIDVGWRVITHGRSPAPFPDQAMAHLSHDLSLENAGPAVANFLAEQGIHHLDLLVHNAATAAYAKITEVTSVQIRETVAVNLTAPLAITWHLFSLLKASKGTVAFIGSVASALPTPNYAVYSATKAALGGFVRSFRQETKETGVKIHIIHPAGTATAMHARAAFPQEMLQKAKMAPAEEVARRIATMLNRGQNGCVSFNMKLATSLCRKLPRVIDPLMARLEKSTWNRPPINDSEAKHIFVTGCQSGIGQALYKAAQSHALGADISPSTEGNTLCVDLTTPQGQEQTLHYLGQQHLVKTAIWNAGINATGRFWEIPWPRQAKVIALNFESPLVMATALAKAQPHCRQVFISSLSHHLSYPGASTYAATKDGLAHFARSLRNAGYASTTVFPGPTDTPHAEQHSPKDENETSGKAKTKRMPPAALAKVILHACEQQKPTLKPGMANKIMAAVGHWSPSLAEAAMRSLLWKKMPPGKTT